MLLIRLLLALPALTFGSFILHMGLGLLVDPNQGDESQNVHLTVGSTLALVGLAIVSVGLLIIYSGPRPILLILGITYLLLSPLPYSWLLDDLGLVPNLFLLATGILAIRISLLTRQSLR